MACCSGAGYDLQVVRFWGLLFWLIVGCLWLLLVAGYLINCVLLCLWWVIVAVVIIWMFLCVG